jgi:hypothetical protein
MDPAEKQRKLNEQYLIEIGLIQKKRKLTSDASYGDNAFLTEPAKDEDGNLILDEDGSPKMVPNAEARQFQAKDKADLLKVGSKQTSTDPLDLTLEKLNDFQRRMGTTAENIAAVMAAPFEGLFNGLSKGIEGLIMGTMKWGQAIRQVGLSIATELAGSFAKMLSSWITTLAKMLFEWVLHNVFKVAIHTAAESTMTAVQQVNSTKRRAESFKEGIMDLWNAATKAAGAVSHIPYVGPILAVVAMAAVMAAGLAMLAFEDGGYTGNGGRSEVAGLVHKGEYVFSAPAVDRIGVANLEAMHSGRGGTAAAGSSGSGPVVNVAVFNDENEIPKWTRTADGEKHLIDIVRRNWHRLQ